LTDAPPDAVAGHFFSELRITGQLQITNYELRRMMTAKEQKEIEIPNDRIE